jgi:hypothetical protein
MNILCLKSSLSHAAGRTSKRMGVDIRLCSQEDIGELMEFLDKHWAKDHVLSWHKPLLDWQHQNRGTGSYNFVLARSQADCHIIGVLGFIPTRHYDPDLAPISTLWLALWKVRPDAKVTGLGLMLLKYLEAIEPHVAIGVAGVGDVAHYAMYRALGYVCGEYHQHFMLNRRINRRSLAKIPDGLSLAPPSRGDATFEVLSADNFYSRVKELEYQATSSVHPIKSPRYFFERFMVHPVYKYQVYLVSRKNRPLALLASRLASYESHHALRIVDYFGDAETFAQIGRAVDEVLGIFQAEYADIWSYGLDEDAITDAGFHPVAMDGPIIIPNLFEPFLAVNSVIRFAFKVPQPKSFMIFRADGDQDRPGMIPRGIQLP